MADKPSVSAVQALDQLIEAIDHALEFNPDAVYHPWHSLKLRLRAPSRATPEEDIVERLKMDLTTETTMHAAWRKRAEEAERGTPVDPAALEPFLREMREVTIPAIVEAVYQRQRAAAVVYPPLRASRATSAPEEPTGPTCGHLTPMCDIGCGSCSICYVFDWDRYWKAKRASAPQGPR